MKLVVEAVGGGRPDDKIELLQVHFHGLPLQVERDAHVQVSDPARLEPDGQLQSLESVLPDAQAGDLHLAARAEQVKREVVVKVLDVILQHLQDPVLDHLLKHLAAACTGGVVWCSHQRRRTRATSRLDTPVSAGFEWRPKSQLCAGVPVGLGAGIPYCP